LYFVRPTVTKVVGVFVRFVRRFTRSLLPPVDGYAAGRAYALHFLRKRACRRLNY
jgi:hypothetical protein